MNSTKNRYAQAIVNDFLELKVSEMLSVNTEEEDLGFARLVADEAMKATDTIVKIVVTENGHPSQVLDFEPSGFHSEPRGFAMLRISHIHKEDPQKDTLKVIIDKDNLGAIQKLGHLAEPILLGRRVAVPWCVCPVYDEDDEENWKALESRLDTDIEADIMAIEYRKKFLAHADIDRLCFEGDETCFSVTLPDYVRFLGGRQVLASGRTFASSPRYDRISFNVESSSLDGSFKAKVKVLGKTIESVFVFKDGKLVSWTDDENLNQLLSFDEALRKPGYMTLSDKEAVLHLGGALIDSLDEMPESEDEIPEFFNRSLYCLDCCLEEKMNVSFIDCGENEKPLMRKGFFLE